MKIEPVPVSVSAVREDLQAEQHPVHPPAHPQRHPPLPMLILRQAVPPEVRHEEAYVYSYRYCIMYMVQAYILNIYCTVNTHKLCIVQVQTSPTQGPPTLYLYCSTRTVCTFVNIKYVDFLHRLFSYSLFPTFLSS